MKKKIRIILIACVAYFLIWLLQLIVWVGVTPGNQMSTALPKFLEVQLWPLVVAFLIVGIVSAIYWRKELWKEITTFINE